MTARQPSLFRRLYPALALTGVGFGLVNVLDRPAPVGPAADGAVGAPDGASSTTILGGDGTGATAPVTGNSVTAQGSSGAAPAAPPATQAPEQQAPAVTVAPPATAAPAGNDCGAVSRTGAETAITWRRTYGVISVTVKATSAGTVCGASADWQAYDQKSVRYEDFAVPILNSQVVSAAGANIQGVSGATAVSEAYVRSLQSAIDQL
jgi:hypothetical protein